MSSSPPTTKSHSNDDKIVIVFINGFLTPKGWVSFPKEMIPTDTHMINVYPSSTASTHDQVCEIFYELKGGTVDYGEKHANFHGHNRYGRHFPQGKYPEWDEHHPVIFMGHSFGGIAAYAMQTYLASSKPSDCLSVDEERDGLFSGHDTNHRWVKAVVTISTPLNGTLKVHPLGMHHLIPRLVKWGSYGHRVSMLVHALEYLNSNWIKKNVIEFDQDHWSLGYHHPHSLLTLVLACAGYGLHSATDISSYDTSVYSQHIWNQALTTFDDTFYFSVAGKIVLRPSLSSPTTTPTDSPSVSVPSSPTSTKSGIFSFPDHGSDVTPTAGSSMVHVHGLQPLLGGGESSSAKWRHFDADLYDDEAIAVSEKQFYATVIRALLSLRPHQRAAPGRVHHHDTKHWLESDSDGLLSLFTQEYPRLSSKDKDSNDYHNVSAKQLFHAKEHFTEIQAGRWQYVHRNASHFCTSSGCEQTWAYLWFVTDCIHKQWRKDKESSIYNDTDRVAQVTTPKSSQYKNVRNRFFAANPHLQSHDEIVLADIHSMKNDRTSSGLSELPYLVLCSLSLFRFLYFVREFVQDSSCVSAYVIVGVGLSALSVGLTYWAEKAIRKGKRDEEESCDITCILFLQVLETIFALVMILSLIIGMSGLLTLGVVNVKGISAMIAMLAVSQCVMEMSFCLEIRQFSKTLTKLLSLTLMISALSSSSTVAYLSMKMPSSNALIATSFVCLHAKTVLVNSWWMALSNRHVRYWSLGSSETKTAMGLGYVLGFVFIVLLGLMMIVTTSMVWLGWNSMGPLTDTTSFMQVITGLWSNEWLNKAEIVVQYFSLYNLLISRIEDYSAVVVYVLTWRKFHHVRFATVCK